MRFPNLLEIPRKTVKNNFKFLNKKTRKKHFFKKKQQKQEHNETMSKDPEIQ